MLFGNTSVDFKPKTLFVIGENLSHVLVGENDCIVENISIYIKGEWLEQVYPESNFIEHFLNQSKLGLNIPDFKGLKIVENILNQSGLLKITHFLKARYLIKSRVSSGV